MRLGDKALVTVENTRGGIGKHSLVLNNATPHVEVDPETNEAAPTASCSPCQPATVLPMGQRYSLFRCG